MIWYFREDLRPSIRAELDAQSRELDSWEVTVEKSVNDEVKTILQSSSSTRNLNSKYPQKNQLAKKKADSRKNKSTDSPLADTPSGKQSSSTQQTSSAYLEYDQNHCGGLWYGKRQDQDSTTTSDNITPKKEKRDFSQVNCFYCKKKGYYTNRCLQKRKQESKN